MARSRRKIALTPTLNSDSGWKGEASRICVQLGAKAQHIFSQFNFVNMATQLVYQTLNRSANAGHRTMERASINGHFDHEKPTRLPDIKPSVGPKA
jgi:hypothetical protein